MPGQLDLQFFQTFPRIDCFRAQSAFPRDRNMQKMHVRRFFIHVNHYGNDIFRADEFREERFAFLEKPSSFLW